MKNLFLSLISVTLLAPSLASATGDSLVNFAATQSLDLPVVMSKMIDQARTPCSREALMLADEGGEHSGGGDVILCGSGVLGRLFPREAYLADTFSLAIKDMIPNQPNLAEEVYLDTALTTLKTQEPEIARRIGSRLASLKFIPASDVPELDDDNIDMNEVSKLTSKYCRKKQLAIQSLATNKVHYDRYLLNKLTPAERALFKIHEAFISERYHSGDTTLIRKQVEGIARDGSFAAFLADTIYQHRIIPKFSASSIKDIVSVFFVLARANGMIFGEFEHFLNPETHQFKSVLEFSSIDQQNHKLRALVLAASMRKYAELEHVDEEMILSAYNRSKNDPIKFAEILHQMNGQTWVSIDKVDTSQLEKDAEFLIKQRPLQKSIISDDLNSYLETLKSYPKRTN